MSDDGSTWTEFTAFANAGPVPWAPRMGATAVVEKGNALNGFVQRLFVIGGQNDDGFLTVS